MQVKSNKLIILNKSNMLRNITITILSFLMTGMLTANAQIELIDNAKISLMTTAPWDGEAYAMYGHTALYVEDDSLGIDAVFNYGFFDMSKPFFMYYFVRGKTDYILGVQSFNDFVDSYGYKGVEVVKQELNLSAEEKQQLWDALYLNHLPENREYRYNFFYDNCVTRPRDLIERFVQGEIKYPIDQQEQSFRDLIHECVGGIPWMKFGIDLVIGNEADSPITLREKMFLPAYLMHALDETIIVADDSLSYPLIKNKSVVLEDVITRKSISEWSITSPLPVAFALFLITLLISFFQFKEKNYRLYMKIYDTVLFGIAGIGGLIIFFLLFFSEHPAVNNNWNFIWLNIFALLFAVFFWIKPLKRAVNLYHLINFAILTLFLLFWWLIPQQLPVASIPFSMSLWMRSGTNTLVLRNKKALNRRFSSTKYMKAGWGQ